MSTREYARIVSKNLRRIASDQNKSQAEIARDLRINKATVSSWMNGTRVPKMENIDMLCHYFNVTRFDIMNEAVEKNEQPNYYTDPVTAEIVEAMSVNPKLKALFHMQSHMNDTEVIASTAFHNMMIAEKQKEERLDQDDPC